MIIGEIDLNPGASNWIRPDVNEEGLYKHWKITGGKWIKPDNKEIQNLVNRVLRQYKK